MAIFTPAPAFIALKADAIILPVYNTKGQGKTYRVCFEKPIELRDYGSWTVTSSSSVRALEQSPYRNSAIPSSPG